ncbi:hypothetical protein Cyast_1979 [Cyanobacterium stanieri PCC 7202]|uniref:O-methyltransferase family 3 n=1 Tax=Cyanobacterium stanieri (strain ATCC 29140 / PCC 7202) TaxID=292563 RepID=K9YN98_CYASC|nr:hypothetical protein Cyast_1979 [Cyanobacterium stanieri PCC 7202]
MNTTNKLANKVSNLIHLKKNDWLVIATLSFFLTVTLFIALSLQNIEFLDILLIEILVIFVFCVLILIPLEIYRRIEIILNEKSQVDSRKRGDIYRQTQALFSVFSVLNPEIPLPTMSGWTVNPDFAKTIMNNILISKPSLVLEMGSGVSTIIAAYSLKKLNQGKIISLEHKSDFVAQSRKQINDHGLQNFAEIIHAPLKKWHENQQEWLWYDISKIESIQSIDIVIVDGPPRKIQTMSRYPALPILFNKLTNNSIIILDDFKRKDLNKMVDLWLKKFSNFQLEVVNTKSGCLILRKIAK